MTDVLTAARELAVLDLTLLGAFIVSVLAIYGLYHFSGRLFCQACVAVSSVWILNLLVGFLPDWVTVFLMGQSVAGAAGYGRDAVSDRFGFREGPKERARTAKQLAYFGFIVLGTLAAAALALWQIDGLAA